MARIRPLTDAELAAYRRVAGPPRADIERVLRAGWQVVATWHHGESRTGRSLVSDVAELERALRTAEPEPPQPPAWRPQA
jgi:hypothetical protein